jgi:hypothetical protein
MRHPRIGIELQLIVTFIWRYAVPAFKVKSIHPCCEW